jgi:hypothetical protein
MTWRGSVSLPAGAPRFHAAPRRRAAPEYRQIAGGTIAVPCLRYEEAVIIMRGQDAPGSVDQALHAFNENDILHPHRNQRSTGWGACVVVGGSRKPFESLPTEVIESSVAERFCFHAPAECSAPCRRVDRAGRRKALGEGSRRLRHITGTCHLRNRRKSDAESRQGARAHSRIPRPGASIATLFRCLPSFGGTFRPLLDVEGRLSAPPWGQDQARPSRLDAHEQWQSTSRSV